MKRVTPDKMTKEKGERDNVSCRIVGSRKFTGDKKLSKTACNIS